MHRKKKKEHEQDECLEKIEFAIGTDIVTLGQATASLLCSSTEYTCSPEGQTVQIPHLQH